MTYQSSYFLDNQDGAMISLHREIIMDGGIMSNQVGIKIQIQAGTVGLSRIRIKTTVTFLWVGNNKIIGDLKIITLLITTKINKTLIKTIKTADGAIIITFLLIILQIIAGGQVKISKNLTIKVVRGVKMIQEIKAGRLHLNLTPMLSGIKYQ